MSIVSFISRAARARAIGVCLVLLGGFALVHATRAVPLDAIPHDTVPQDAASASSRREAAYRHNNLGVARLEQYDYPAAVTAFQRAIETDPALAVARLNLAIALLYDTKFDAADREAAAAATALPDAPQPAYVRGLIARASDRAADAIASFRRVLSIDQADVGSKVQLGQLSLEARQYAEAVTFFEDAVRLDPFNATAAYGLAMALTRGGRADDGAKAMARFQQLRENPAAITYSTTYLEQGAYAEAMASTGLEPELIDRSTPSVVFADATTGTIEGGADAIVSSHALADVDADGDLDLITVGSDAVRVRLSDGRRFAASAGRDLRSEGTTALLAVAGDYDNDGRADLFIAGHPTHRLFHQEADRTFRDVSAQAQLPAAVSRARVASFVDVDHDGDLDIFVTGDGTAGAAGASASARPHQLLRNLGNGRFSDVTEEAKLTGAPAGAVVGVVPTDYDNRRDVDLLILANGARPALFSNQRDGTFVDVADRAGLPAAAAYTTVAAADANKDGVTDFFFGRAGAPGLLVSSEASTRRFTVSAAPADSRDTTEAQFLDYDNDGLLDLLALTASGPKLWRHAGAWTDVSARALPQVLQRADDRPVALATGDLDADGDVDAIVRLSSGRLRVWRNDEGNRWPSLRIRLTSRVSNRSAPGAKVELRAGSLRQKVETAAVTPAIGPSDVSFGLGARERADVVRVLWPAGILQAETDVPAATASATAGKAAVMPITELDRKPSSCPFLFTWNGTRFEFITDFMGGGEMGAWIGPGLRNVPDPDEYVRIRGDQLRPRDGRYELRVTNELEEALFVDRLHLLAIAHPAGVDVHPNEGLFSPEARRPATIYTVRDPQPPRRAIDDHGHDVLDRVTRMDRRYPDDFRLESIQGYAEEHGLTLAIDTPRADARTRLLLTGWTDYAFSSDNLAAHQAGLPFVMPALQMRDASGQWQTVLPEIGLPIGRPQTVVVDLTDVLRQHASASAPPAALTEVRIVTTLRVYWDQILVDSASAPPAPFTVTRMEPIDARLQWRGFSAETTPDGRPPFGYDYHRVTPLAPWKTLPGRYTREGDVKPLLASVDDRFIVSAPGDEIALSFDASALPPLPAAWTRTFFLYVDGFSKEMNLLSGSPDRLEPLPFHGMSGYPYPSTEQYPRTPEHDRYRAEYNTRSVGGPVPSLLPGAAAPVASAGQGASVGKGAPR